MIPGIPVMAIGRNPWIAWGGTNLHAASSELFDVSGLPAAEISERRVRIAVRWSRPRDLVLRDSAYGPIISDAPLFGRAGGRDLALRWVGHQPSDEVSALLALNRARDWTEFRRAAEDFAVPGQTLVYADGEGRVGRLRAARLPRRGTVAPDDFFSAPADMAAWREHATTADLPAEFDPPRGFIVSANDRPPAGDIPIGWFFAPNDRADRLTALLSASDTIGFADLALLQTDVAACGVLILRDRLCAGLAPAPRGDAVFDAMAGWDGMYHAQSPGALAFELVLAHLVTEVTPPARRALYSVVWHGRRLLAREIDAVLPEQLIPSPADQDRCAQLRRPMDMIVHGWSTRRFQAKQQ